MSSNFDNLLSGAWKRSPQQTPNDTEEPALPLRHPLPTKPQLPIRPPRSTGPALPIDPTLPASPAITVGAKPKPKKKTSKEAPGAVPEPEIEVNPSKHVNDSIDPDSERDHTALRAHEQSEDDAELKRSTILNESNAQINTYSSSPRRENRSSQRAPARSLAAITARIIQLKGTEPGDGANKSASSPPTHKETIFQLQGVIQLPKEKSSKGAAFQPTERKSHKFNTPSSPGPACEAETTQLKDKLHALYLPDPTRATRRAALIAEHDAKAKQSSIQRDEEIKAAKTKHLTYVKELEDELERNLRELDRASNEKQSDQRHFESTLADLNSLTPNQGRKFNTSNFLPKLTIPIAKLAIVAKAKPKKPFIPFRLPPSKPPREVSEEPTSQDSQASALTLANTSPPTISDAIPFEQTSSPSLFAAPNYEEPIPRVGESSASTSFNSDRKVSQTLTTTDTSNSFTSEPSSSPRKRKSQESPSNPNKKPRTTTTSSILTPSTEALPTPTPAPIPSYIEADPIRPKLTAYPFCFVSAWNVDIKDENLKLMRKMVEHFKFYPEAVRADKTGYFLIFESSERGENMGAACVKHFKKWKFRGQHMYMSFWARGSAVDGR